MKVHANFAVQAALINLSDELCKWERITGIQSVFILREQGGFEHRAVNGKPVVIDDISDKQLLNMVS